jgi:hypothetical protein
MQCGLPKHPLSLILPVVLYGYELWSLIIRDGHILRVFENRMLRRIFGPRRDEVTREEKLYNEELHNLYSSPSMIRAIKSRRVRWTVYAARMGENMNACRILVGKPYRKRPLGGSIHGWVDNIRMDDRMGWNTAINFRVL